MSRLKADWQRCHPSSTGARMNIAEMERAARRASARAVFFGFNRDFGGGGIGLNGFARLAPT